MTTKNTRDEHRASAGETSGPSNFIRTIIDADLASGAHQQVVTRFPPEPNGYLHIGHAKSICLNFGLANDYTGRCHLRFDDTNPETEDPEFVKSIQGDVRWLGFEWGENLYFASDYFEQLYGYAQDLIRQGKAYVCSLNEEEMRAYRGSVSEVGRPSPDRERPIEESLDLFERMRHGEFDEGTYTLRAKIDMSSPNFKMRDPPIYRIRKAHHYRQGDEWSVYPMYDFAHCLSDAIEGITHSLCTLEFENNRELYDWILDQLEVPSRPHQYEFARLNLSYTVMSKRKLLRLVTEGYVDGWDDPRMYTIAGLRRRGYTPEAIQAFAQRIGVAKANSVVDMAVLEGAVRDDLNTRSPRAMCVLDPLKVVLTNYPDGEEHLSAPWWPEDMGKEGSRQLPFSAEILIEKADFMEAPEKRFRRLAPGREVRLRYGYIIRCNEVIKNDAGEIVELRCTYDPQTRGGNAPDGRKIKGTIHWVSAGHATKVEVRLYDRLFAHERPGVGKADDFLAHLNKDSLTVLPEAFIEPALGDAAPGTHYQFERLGFFFVDPVASAEGKPVFNRTVSLKDTWSKRKKGDEPPAKQAKAAPRAQAPQGPPIPELDAAGQARADGYRSAHALGESDAAIIASSAALTALFDEAIAAGGDAALTANWVVNDVARTLKETDGGALPFGGEALAELVGLIKGGTISNNIAKEIFDELAAKGGKPGDIVGRRGLRQVSDEAAIEALIDPIIAANPNQVEKYRAGKTALLGFFVGQVMKASGGRANPKLTQSVLKKKLG